MIDFTTQDIISLVEIQAIHAGVNPQQALKVIDCESDFDPYAKNPNSTAKGLAQFLDGTWEWIHAPATQEDVYWSVVMFMKYYNKYPQWWDECNK